MKYIFILILLLSALNGQSSNASPNALNTDVVASAVKPSFTITEYFSFDGLDPVLAGQEWYAFVAIKAPEKKFWIKSHAYLSTVSKKSGTRSETKVECQSAHNELHDCFISHKRIDIREENLVVEMVFQQEVLFELRVEVNTVRMITLGESVGLRRGDANFTRLLRMDVGAIKESFDYLQLDFGEVFVVDEYTNSMSFGVSFEEMPPDSYRYDASSIPLWDDRELALFSFEELQEVSVVTILCGINDHNSYRFSSKLITSPAPRQKLVPNEVLYEIAEGKRSYKLELPTRNSNIYYLLRINIQNSFDFNLTEVHLNGGGMLNEFEVLKLLLSEGSTKSNNELDIWLNSTVTSLEFALSFSSLSVYTLELTELDINLIALKQNVKWNDHLTLNQTQFVYFVIDTKNSDDALNFEVEAGSLTGGYKVIFHNCVEKELAGCQAITTSTNKTKRAIGMPVIEPTKQTKALTTFYRFNNYSITKHEIQPYLYRSIVIAEVRAIAVVATYEIRWHMTNPVTAIKQNELVQGKVEANEPRVFSFTVLDASSLAFARVHFLRGTASSYVFGATSLVNLETLQSRSEVKGLIYEFDGSITFTELTNRTTYYVYIISTVRDVFDLTLTYGYNLDDSVAHPVSFLTLGEHSSNHLVLQPQEILFIEVRSNVSGLLTATNTVPLKICEFMQVKPPRTHKDMSNSHYCETYSTVNRFYTYSFNNTGKFFLGIENENTQPASIQLETSNALLTCAVANLGKNMFLHIDNAKEKVMCVRYEIPEKGEIEILVDIKNPKLQGIALPQVSIGKWKTVMSSNLLLLTAANIDSYCQENYEECQLFIEITIDENHRAEQEFIVVNAAYTNQPLPLKDGLAHHTSVKPGEVKHFKYPLYNLEDLTATIQNLEHKAIRIYARVINANEKFVYPSKEEYEKNASGLYVSSPNSYFYPVTLTITSDKLKADCDTSRCYLLLSVTANPNSTLTTKFLLQVTQTVSTLTAGTRLQKYLQKDSKAYFNYRNNQPNSTLLFFTSSNSRDCLKLDVYAGNKGANSQFAIKSGIEEVVVPNANAEWYTVSVKAQDSCYFTIQASTTTKSLRELSLGFANYFTLAAGEKRYYLIHNKNVDHVKIVASLSQKTTGQLSLQAMPVPDDSLGDFIRFINGDTELGKRSRLAFVWSDINHLTIRSSDSRFCKECYICIEAQSSQAVEGYLTIPSSNSHSLFLSSYISYDVLLAKESFAWLAGSEAATHDVYVAVQAGEVQLSVENSKGKELWRKSVKFDKADASKNVVQVRELKVELMDHLSIRIEAVENSDYSIYSTRKSGQKREDRTGFVEVGRPQYLYIYDGTTHCLDGQLSDTKNQFIISTHSERALDSLRNSLNATLTIDGKQAKMEREMTPNALLLTIDPALHPTPNSKFQICFSISDPLKPFGGNFLYLGSLNYFPQNTALHIKTSMNLTFMSEGRGVIEVDECASRSVITLNNQYKEVKSMSSSINSRRAANNLILFTYSGPVFMHVDSNDYVALSWKNYHKSNLNGFGYDIYAPSTFRIAFDPASLDISVRVKPIEAVPEAKDLPDLLSITYHVFVAGEEMELYNAMNCEKGKFMYWVRRVDVPEEIKLETTVKLNKVADLKSYFKGKEYVLFIVKAEVVMRWPKNNFTERYRFYYPYQELLLSQFHVDELTEEKEEAVSPVNPVGPQEQSSSFSTVAFVIVAVVVVAVLTVLAIRWLKRKYWRSNPFVTQFDEQRSESIENGTELPTKSKQENYAPPT